MIFPETLSIELTDRMFRKEQPTILLKNPTKQKERCIYWPLGREKLRNQQSVPATDWEDPWIWVFKE
jgi:hypothetical protein